MDARLRSRVTPVFAATFVLAACTSGGSTSAPTSAPTPASTASTNVTAGGTVAVRLTNPFDSYNLNTTEGNGLWNLEVLNAVLPWVAKFDDHANAVVDKDLVTVTKKSERPLAVQYAFNPAAVWSDGQPVGCDDVYLAWVANNGLVKSTDTGISMFQAASTTGWDQIADVACSADGKSATLTYSRPFSDWSGLVGALLPAHVVAAHAGLSSPAAIRSAYEARDTTTLQKLAAFWNTGFTMANGLDPTVHLSAGPYRIDGYDPDQSVTLVRNERYWGPPGQLETIVFRVITDQGAQAQALANREVNVIGVAGADPDAVSRIKSLDGVTVDVSSSHDFEHIDFNFQVPLFQDKAVRQAVADCIPRQEILDKLVKPIDTDATLLENRILFLNQAGYTNTSGGRYDRVDIAAAKAVLEASGWTLDDGVYVKNGQRLEFRLLHKNVAPRSAIARLVQASCAAAGIAVVDDLDPAWAQRLGAGQFDAVDFSWGMNGLFSEQPSIYHTPAGPENRASNNGLYSNPQVDELMDILATESDHAKLVDTANRADALLWDDLATIPLYQLPGVAAWTNNIRGVRPNGQGLTWNLETWTVS
jgi:ABC-type transport system substrate-binding protein